MATYATHLPHGGGKGEGFDERQMQNTELCRVESTIQFTNTYALLVPLINIALTSLGIRDLVMLAVAS